MTTSHSHLVTDLMASDQQYANKAFEIPELIPPQIARAPSPGSGARLNLVLPALFENLVYGGIATGLRLFRRLAQHFESTRIILLNQLESQFDFRGWPGWTPDRGPLEPRSVAFPGDGASSLTVTGNDFFVATFWTTAVYVKQIAARQQDHFPQASHRFVYLIQDYEAAFYPWSCRYSYARSTYVDSDNSTIAVFNSGLLAEYFARKALRFAESYVFEPLLNPKLRQKRAETKGLRKERLILVYGRPSTARNALHLLVEALRVWARSYATAHEWAVVSVGEEHPDIPLSDTVVLRSKGKLSLDEYAEHLAKCWAGLSFMLSPHPSYPPLEMAEFGAWVITNRFENKNLSELARNIISIDMDALSPQVIADQLILCCDQYRDGASAALAEDVCVFKEEADEFPFAPALARSWRTPAGAR